MNKLVVRKDATATSDGHVLLQRGVRMQTDVRLSTAHVPGGPDATLTGGPMTAMAVGRVIASRRGHPRRSETLLQSALFTAQANHCQAKAPENVDGLRWVRGLAGRAPAKGDGRRLRPHRGRKVDRH